MKSLYNTDKTVYLIKTVAKEQKIAIGLLLKSCGLNRDAINLMTRRGPWLQSNNLAKIADELDCSVDYLLGRTENKQVHHCPIVVIGEVSGNYNAIVSGSTDVTITNTTIGGQAAVLLDIFDKLTPMEKAKLMVYADDLKNNKG